MSERTPASSLAVRVDSEAGDTEESMQVRRWRQLAATGWAMAFLATAAALVGWIRPTLVPGYGPNSVSFESQWEDFEFRYPDAVTAFWQPWTPDSEALGTVLGEVWWSESAQQGLARFTGLESLVSVDAPDAPLGEAARAAGHEQQMVYQLWISESADADPMRISAGLFEVSHASAEADEHADHVTLVPFEPAMPTHHAQAVWVTIEHAGGVWVSDLSRPVARAVLPSAEESLH